MFVDRGTDIRILKSLPKENLIKLEKSYPGTVPVEIYIDHTVDGKAPFWKTVHKKQITMENLPHSKFINPKYQYFNAKTRKVYTLKQIIKYYNDLPVQHQPDFEEFILDNYFVSDRKNSSTSQAYKLHKGKYKPSRFKYVHKPIIDRKLAEADVPPPGVKPICYMFGGGSASGKSTVINSIVEPLIQHTGLKFARMDCDALKPEIPEYNMLKEENNETVATRVHRESSDLCMECIYALIEQGKCFTYDGVMGNYERTEKLVKALKAKGYEVRMIATDVPIDIALERASKRSRKISEDIIRYAHETFAEAWAKTIQLPFDSFALYDNSQPEGQLPTCIMDESGIYHQEYYYRFMKKCEEAANYGN